MKVYVRLLHSASDQLYVLILYVYMYMYNMEIDKRTHN